MHRARLAAVVSSFVVLKPSLCCGDCIASFNREEGPQDGQSRATRPSMEVLVSRPSEGLEKSGRAAELSIEEMEYELSKRRSSR